ncbi:hypothetical protein L6164_016464 [Bauhinia variegata]|uniref:Uncharacterized protein n=1 Tax=Bauhinia variegata TaxID=167791 RepID=A0ACB9NNR2_BAUVA|nr:hypothetical protein L6164_016464 [Bauhinia variegata]
MVEVKLLGFWSSPFVHRVIWALKLKGISYEYIEEDRFNKSQLLLESNPVHKKVPVLIHGGKVIAESVVILEYIEETWPENPLLPEDAYERASARFWIKFGENSVLPITAPFFQSYIDEQEKAIAIKKSLEILQVLEEQGLGDKKFFGGNSFGLVDIIYGSLALWLQVLEEIIGIKLIEPTNLPHLHAWIQNLKQVSVIKENFPDHQNLQNHLKWRRQGIMHGSQRVV